MINRKLASLKSRVVYIEAVKEGEEPISFGNDAFLVNYGHGWKLKAVIESDFHGNFNFLIISFRISLDSEQHVCSLCKFGFNGCIFVILASMVSSLTLDIMLMLMQELRKRSDISHRRLLL